jgi:hypothetical protein
MSKQFGNEDILVDLITKACVAILPEQTTFNVDNVRVCKVSHTIFLFVFLFSSFNINLKFSFYALDFRKWIEWIRSS